MSRISELVWDTKYRLYDLDNRPREKSVSETLCRVAKFAASNEHDLKYWEIQIQELLEDNILLPAGRILANAGTNRDATLINTFFAGEIKDDFGSILKSLTESAKTLRMGGGVGCNFSNLRPQGFIVRGTHGKAPGPIPFMRLWNSMCETIERGTGGKGAMMASLSCSHPDIEEFILAKQEAEHLKMFNLSILIDNTFMKAIENGDNWMLHFGNSSFPIDANELWQKIMRATYLTSEPGVIFIDRINELNNLAYCEQIVGTNSCGEQPLPYYGACPLASINLATLISAPFSASASLDFSKLEKAVKVGIRFLDNIIDLSRYPHKKHQEEAMGKRRIGLGVTGLADALAMCGVRYGCPESIELVRRWMNHVKIISYKSSIGLSKERGAFPKFNSPYFIRQLQKRDFEEEVINEIKKDGVRNALLNSVAPTGSISLFAGNVSSGIEPIFAFRSNRKITLKNGDVHNFELLDYAVQQYYELFSSQSNLPNSFVDVGQLTPNEHLLIQSTTQKHIDGSISKTINCPKDISFDEFQKIYQLAYNWGCKGCTTFRPTEIRGEILSPS